MMAVVALLASCSSNKLKVTKTNFAPETAKTQNLVFKFNKEVVKDTNLLQRWDTTEYIVFEPKIKGRFMWTSKSELTFSPSAPLMASTNYKAALTNAILQTHKSDLALDSKIIEFHTQYLNLMNVQSFWALSENMASRVEVRLHLTFNNPVQPSQLKPLLKVLVEGKEQNIQVLTQSESELIEVAFSYETKSAKDSPDGEVVIDKGLGTSGSAYKTTDPIKMAFAIPAKDDLAVSEVVPDFEDGKGILKVYCTQPVTGDNIAQYIKVTPEVDFKVEPLANGFVLKGDFVQNQSYILKINGSIQSVFNRKMGEEYVETVNFGTTEPYLAFTERNALYLSNKGERNLGIKLVNVNSVKVSVFKIFENNILHYIRKGQSWGYEYDDDDYHDYYGWEFDEDYGKPIFSKTIQTKSLPKMGNLSLLNLDLTELQFSDPYKGLYLVRVESSDKKWLQGTQMVSLSDLGMIVKEGTDDILVFVNSLKDASPVSGAKVELISNNNQKVLSGTTDKNGVAVFKNTKQQAAGFRISMATVKSGDDFNFMLFNQSRVETSRFDAGGKRTAGLNYDVFVYGDRDLYRPGDSIYFNTIARTLRWETVKDMPVKIQLIAPNGRVYKTMRKTLNSEGAVSGAFFVPQDAMTGVYLMQVLSMNDILLTSRHFAVEEFMPDRIKATVKTDKTVYQPGSQITVDILAENLYGTPAANRKYEVEMRISRKYFNPKNYPDYQFDIRSENSTSVYSNIVTEGKTESNGTATQTLQAPSFKDVGILDGTIFTTVFDETGRPVNRINQIEIPTQPVFFGIKYFDYWVSTRKPMNFNFVAVDREGKPRSAERATVVVLYYKYETVIENDNGRYRYVSQRKESRVMSKEVIVRGTATPVAFTPSKSGEYEVRIIPQGSESYVSARFWAYGWSDTDYSSFEVNREGEVTITADQEAYKVGEKAKLLFKAPFDGKMLVSFEQNNTVEYRYVDLVNKSASLEIPIGKDHLPNVFVNATAFKKISNTEIPLTVAHGLISLKVEDPSTKLKVDLVSLDRSKSNTKQDITVRTAPNAEVTLAVVDEGILQITNYKSPDPYAWFYGKRALEVNSYDVYAQLYPELSSSFGGGSPFDLSRRVNPLTNKRVKLVSIWSGILKADASGNVKFTVDIPAFSGALRVMAVAYKGNAFGSAEKQIKVADDIVVSTSLPRFTSPGDKVSMSVNLANTTIKSCNATVSVTATPPLKVAGDHSANVSIGPNSEAVADFNIEASQMIGNGKVTVTVNNGAEKFTQEVELTVRPASGLTYVSESGVVKAGENKQIDVNSNLLPYGIKSKMVLSLSPAAEFAANLDYLLRYPYGCLEQTVSAAFPQIYLRDLATVAVMANKRINPDLASDMPDYNVQQAITKVESMQLYNGGLSMWPEGGNAQWWTTAYATHFLIEAQKAGFEVNDKVLERALKFLDQKSRDREESEYFYYSGATVKSRKIARQEIFYSVYVLALADKAPKATMNYYKSKLDQMSMDSRYLLAASYLLSGDKRSYQSVLPATFGTDKAVNQFDGSFASFVRERALALNCLLEVDPSNSQVPELVMILSSELRKKSNYYYSTQDNAQILLALGKLAKKQLNSNITATISVDGANVGTFKNKELLLNNDLNDKKISISAEGKGEVYYYYELSGLTSTPAKGDLDNYLKVRKRFFDRNGKELNASTPFKQSDLIVVEVMIQASSGTSVENVVVTDLLPACFEIENSRLVTERELPWAKSQAYADYTDIRDDRISYFTTAYSSPRYFYYTVRAVSKGTYQMGAVSADAMYNGMYRSYSGARVVTVQ